MECQRRSRGTEGIERIRVVAYLTFRGSNAKSGKGRKIGMPPSGVGGEES